MVFGRLLLLRILHPLDIGYQHHHNTYRDEEGSHTIRVEADVAKEILIFRGYISVDATLVLAPVKCE